MKYFGTDGIRGKVGELLTAELAYKVGRFLGSYNKTTPTKIIISRDTRISGEMLFISLSKGIKDSGGIAYDEGISSTPSISYLVRKRKYDFGVMITASHNSYLENGLKIFSSSGEKIPSELEAKIEEYLDLEEANLEKKEGMVIFDQNAKNEYTSFLFSSISSSLEGIKVAVDSANGSASKIVPALFSKLGIEATYIGDIPDGKNINLDYGSTHIDNLVNIVKEGEFDLGLAFDGDGDRLIALDSKGNILDGDHLLYLFALSLKKKGELKHNKIVVTPFSNLGLINALKEEEIECVTSEVGEKAVIEKLKENDLSLGGEKAGHIIFLDSLPCGDGILAALKLCEIYLHEKDLFQKLSWLDLYHQKIMNFSFENNKKLQEITDSDRFTSFFEKMSASLVSEGRVYLRTSGTEPTLRVMVETSKEETLKNLCENIEKFIQEIN
ncbi:MAG: phosphoglucosamine mutase [Bacilli bacterium]|nr:phosphoglucosamine mutase [Bacilli bacterium]